MHQLLTILCGGGISFVLDMSFQVRFQNTKGCNESVGDACVGRLVLVVCVDSVCLQDSVS